MASQHEPVFASTLVYFVFSFSSSKPLDINSIADRLLAADIAETVASPARQDVRVAPRFRHLVRSLRDATVLSELERTIESKSSLWTWARKHPRMATRILTGILWDRLRGRNRLDQQSESEAEPLRDTVQNIRRAVADAQALNAIQQTIESRAFRPDYLASEPYVRLRLRDTHQWWDLLDGGESRTRGDDRQGFSADALLLLHRSGVVQLTLALPLPTDLYADDLIDMIHANSPRLAASEYPEPLLEAADPKGSSRWLGDWQSEEQAGARWRRVPFDKPSSVAQLFEVYLDAISKAAHINPNTEWMCYPVVCIDKLGCCSSEEEWMSNHRQVLAAVVARFRKHERLREDAVDYLLPDNASLLRQTSVFYSHGATTRIEWPVKRSRWEIYRRRFRRRTSTAAREDQPTFDAHLWALLVVESALLQSWQLRALDARLSATLRKPKDVRRVQAEVIYGLEEYRSSRLTFGDAAEAVQLMLDSWGADRLYARILESLDQLQQRVANDEALRAARRANLLATAAAFVAVVLGLPAVSQSMEIARTIPAEGFLGWLAEPVRNLAEQGASGVWLGYLVVLLLVFGMLLLTVRAGRSRTQFAPKRRPAPAGDAWPLGTVKVVSRDQAVEGEDEEEPLRGWWRVSGERP